MINKLTDLLFYGPLLGLPVYAGARHGLRDMEKSYEPLEVRLRKITNRGAKVKTGSEKNELFKEFREKVAAGEEIAKMILPSVLSGTALASGISGLGGGIKGVTSPASDVAGYQLYRKMFPGVSGMLSYTRAPEEALKGGFSAFGKELGASAATGIKNMIDSAMRRNEQIINSSPRRKLILDQLRREDELIKNIPLKTMLEAYHSMVKVAPTLSTDKNAVKSFFRSVAMAPEGGVDWNTLKGLAEAEISVNKAKMSNS